MEVSTTAGLQCRRPALIAWAPDEQTPPDETSSQRKKVRTIKNGQGAEREMTYCRIFDTNTLGYSSLFFFSSFSFLSAHLFTSRTQSRQPQWHQGRPWELAWAGGRRLLVHIYIGARRSVRTYVCLMGSELVHLRLHRPSLF